MDDLGDRLQNCHNAYQDNYKKILCVCSAGLLRSPTAALVLSQPPFDFNTRCAGIISRWALIKVDAVLVEWCDEIVCMTHEHHRILEKKLIQLGINRPIICLDIPDEFKYRDPELMKQIAEKYAELRGIRKLE